MPYQTLKGEKVPLYLWTQPHTIEDEALQQLRNITALPWVFHHVAAMPDVHFGKGATVGSVIAMKEAVSPAAVGVDIGCGMMALQTNLKANDLPENLAQIRHQIERTIPVGFNEHPAPIPPTKAVEKLFKNFKDLDSQVASLVTKAQRQMGTLGGGNHFIELCLDSKNQVWLMLHSGSRNIGKTLAEIHIEKAKKLAHNQNLPDRDLAVFLAGTKEMKAYRHDLFWAQNYALLNRETMVDLYFKTLQCFFPQLQKIFSISCHHNYVAEEVHFGEKVLVTRKGAINAEYGQYGIIPGSMGSQSYLVKGLGNPHSFHSASHGAGRKMSRHQAKKKFNLKDLESQTQGVECRKDGGVLDEIPGAYKNIEEVIENQKDLVEVIATLKQVLCVKG